MRIQGPDGPLFRGFLRLLRPGSCGIAGPGLSGGDGLGAELAAGGGEGDFAEALRAGARGGRFGLGRVEFPEQVLGGSDEEEVDDGGEDEEVDDGGDEGAVEDLAAVNIGDEVVEVGFADEGAEQRVDDVLRQGGDDPGEGGADDDGDGQIHYVATENEVTETFKQDHTSVHGMRPFGWERV